MAIRNKYNVAPKDERTHNGIVYDSKAEMLYAQGLDQQLQAGDITGWVRQVTIPLGEDFKTRIDFLEFYEWDDETVVLFVEIKGMETPRFKDVRRLWDKYGPGPLHIKKRRGNSWTTETIDGKC